MSNIDEEIQRLTAVKAIVESLTDAKGKRSWLDVAAAFRDGLSHTRSRASRQAFEGEAARVSRYTLGMLKRYVKVLEFLEKIPKEMKPDRLILEQEYTVLELIYRLHGRDADRAFDLLDQLRTDPVRVVDVKGELGQSGRGGMTAAAEPVSDMSAAATTRFDRNDIAFAKVRGLLWALSGAFDAYHAPIGRNTTPIRCDAIAWIDKNKTVADGYEFAYVPAQTTHAQLAGALSRAAMSATFFRRYYVVFSADSDTGQVNRAVSALNLLKVESIGVVHLGPDSRHSVPRRPTGPANPDRQIMLQQFCPNGRFVELVDTTDPAEAAAVLTVDGSAAVEQTENELGLPAYVGRSFV